MTTVPVVIMFGIRQKKRLLRGADDAADAAVGEDAVRHCVAAGFAGGVHACALCNGSGIFRVLSSPTVAFEYSTAIGVCK